MKRKINSSKKIKIDATGKALGRLASEIAKTLLGKNHRDYSFEKNPNIKVLVENASRIKITRQKLATKVYYRHSGYPGGIKTVRLNELYSKKPDQLLHLAVRKMLPKNKQRNTILKQLSITK